MNEYEKDNPLQKSYSALSGSCLCTMRESCPNCDGTRRIACNVIHKLAKSIDYQLYYRDDMTGKMMQLRTAPT